MIYSEKIADVTTRPDVRGRCWTGMEILAGIGAASAVVSTGMGIAGAAQQSAAQQQAGQIAYQNALIRQQQQEAEARRLENEAIQRQNMANAEAAAAQRKAIEERRRARILAGRAQTVMAASGAGVDEGILAGILGEGDLAFDTALYEGETREQTQRYQGDLNRYEAKMRRWQGDTEVASGLATRDAMNQRAANTLTTGIIGGVAKLGSLASKYGGGL